MNKTKYFALMLVITSSPLLVNQNAFALDLPDKQIAAMSKAEYMAYKETKGEEQRALAMSKLPEVVGEDILEQEADGMYMLPQQALDNWGNGRMFPDRSLVKGN
ncbi:MAG: hypothetical protein ABL933_06545 [Methyloglobulus sp.]|nr:hypothetical protein [Methyloglobulus sp.]